MKKHHCSQNNTIRRSYQLQFNIISKFEASTIKKFVYPDKEKQVKKSNKESFELEFASVDYYSINLFWYTSSSLSQEFLIQFNIFSKSNILDKKIYHTNLE